MPRSYSQIGSSLIHPSINGEHYGMHTCQSQQQQQLCRDSSNESCSSFDVSTMPKPILESAQFHQCPISPSIKVRKSVTFYPTVRCRGVTHARDMSPEQRRLLWLSPRELNTIKREVRQRVNYFDAESAVEHGDLECQGVEYYRKSEHNKRTKHREFAYGTVFEMQRFFRDLRDFANVKGDFSEAIGRRYSLASTPSQEKALSRANKIFLSDR